MSIQSSTLETVAERIGLVGRGRVFAEQLKGLSEAAASDTPLLLQGEPGIQFQRCARFIHLCSNRVHQEFIPCDCSALTATQFEKKLLAYSNGCSYDQRDRPAGLLGGERSGTLFFNNIGALPSTVKLLRLLQAGEYRRIGVRNVQTLNLRLILSVIYGDYSDFSLNTQSNGLERRRFFEDVKVGELRLPPLRKRRDDVPDLLEYFARKYADKISCHEVVRFDRSAINWLCEYPWPRNDQQLEELVEKLTEQGTRQVSMNMVRRLLPPAVSQTIPIMRKTESVLNTEPEDTQQQIKHPSDNHDEPFQNGSSAPVILLGDAVESPGASHTPIPAVVNGPPANASDIQSRKDSSQKNVLGEQRQPRRRSEGVPSTEGEQEGETPRKRRYATLITVGVAILLAWLLGYVSRGWFSTPPVRDPQRSNGERRGIDTDLDDILRLTDDYRFEDARQLLETAESRVTTSSGRTSIRILEQRLGRLESHENERKRQFTRLATGLMQSTELDEKEISAARRFVRTEDEWEQLANISEQHASRVESNRIAEFTRFVNDLLQSSPVLDEASLSSARRLARTDVEWQQLNDIERQASQHPALLISMSVAVGDAGAFEAALQRYAATYATTARAKEFKQVLRNGIEVLRIVEQWNTLIDNHSPRMMWSLDPEQAPDLRQRAMSLLETCDGLPGSEYVRNYLLVHARAREEQQAARLQQVIGLLNEEWVRAPFVYEWTDGSRYYLTEEPDSTNADQQIACQYFADLKSTRKRIRLSTSGLSNYLFDRSASIANVGSIVDRLDETNWKNWESAFIDIVSRIRSDDGLGVSEKVYFMREFVRLACAGSPAFRKGFSEYLERLDEADFAGDGTWLEPQTEANKTAKVSSEQVWKLLEKIHAQCVTSTWQALVNADSENIERLRWCGWLLRDNGEWKLEATGGFQLSKTTPLHIIRRQSVNEPLRLTEIGTINDIPSQPVLVQGLPVFLVETR